MLAEKDPQAAARYAKIAIDLIGQLVEQNAYDLDLLRRDEDFNSLRDRPEFLAFLHEHGLSPRFGYLATNSPGVEVRSISNHGPSPDLDVIRDLIGKGFSPRAIATSPSPLDEEASHFASVWHRPLPLDEFKENLAQRQANAAVALLRMGVANDDVWAFFRHRQDLRAQSYLVHRLRVLKVSPIVLRARLVEENRADERRALLLALGEYSLSSFTELERSDLLERVALLYQRDSDPGIHSTSEWLLRQWSHADLLGDIGEKSGQKSGQKSSEKSGENSERGWYVDQNEHAMVVIRGPVQFEMGSSLEDRDRDSDELRHQRLIPRSFALSAKPTTVVQFRKYYPSFSHSREKSPTADCPTNSVSWYEAAKYCRWLSELAEIPEHEMCYPSIGQIREGMKLPDDYLSRVGFRLPTEAEFEYAARAGTSTSRHYGNSEVHMTYYDRCNLNSSGRIWPSAKLRPNHFGFFDATGNVRQWCQDWESSYNLPRAGEALRDSEQQRGGEVLKIYRAASYSETPNFVRSSDRLGHRPDARYNQFGFRVARTHLGLEDIPQLTDRLAVREDADTLFLRGRIHEAAGEWKTAEADYARASELSADDPRIWFRLGHLHALDGNSTAAIEDFGKAIHLDAKNATYYRRRAEAYVEQREWEKAILDYSVAVGLEPTDDTLPVARILVMISAREYARALTEINAIIANGERGGGAWTVRGRLYYKMREYPSALRDLKHAVKLEPNDDDHWIRLGHVQFAMDDHFEAENSYLKAVKLDANDPDAHVGLAEVAFDQERWEVAIAEYEEAKRLDPAEASHLAHRGLAKYRMGDVEGLVDINQAITQDPTNADCLRIRGNLLSELGQHIKAVDDLTKAIELDRGEPYYLHDRGEVYYTMKRYELAEADFSKALELARELDQDDAEFWSDRGFCRRRLGRYDDSFDDFDRAVRLDPKNASYMSFRGDAHYYCRRYIDAINDYTKVTEMLPGYSVVYNDRGDAHLALGDLELALQDYTKAIEVGPNPAAYFYRDRADVLIKLGRLEQAASDLRGAAKIQADPKDDAVDWNNLGSKYHANSQFREAIQCYAEAIRLNPDDIIYGNQATTFSSLNMWAQAVESYGKAIDLNETRAELRNGRGVAYYRMAQWDEAIADFSDAVRLDETIWLYHRNLGNTRAQKSDLKSALSDYEMAISLDCGHAQTWHEYVLLCLVERGQTGRLDACELLKKRLGDDKSLTTVLCLARCQTVDPNSPFDPEFIDTLEPILAWNQGYESASTLALGALAYRQREFSEATELLQQVLAREPTAFRLRRQIFLALTYRRTDRLEEAQQVLAETLVEIDALLAKPLAGKSDSLRWSDRLELTMLKAEATATD